MVLDIIELSGIGMEKSAIERKWGIYMAGAELPAMGRPAMRYMFLTNGKVTPKPVLSIRETVEMATAKVPVTPIPSKNSAEELDLVMDAIFNSTDTIESLSEQLSATNIVKYGLGEVLEDVWFYSFPKLFPIREGSNVMTKRQYNQSKAKSTDTNAIQELTSLFHNTIDLPRDEEGFVMNVLNDGNLTLAINESILVVNLANFTRMVNELAELMRPNVGGHKIIGYGQFKTNNLSQYELVRPPTDMVMIQNNPRLQAKWMITKRSYTNTQYRWYLFWVHMLAYLAKHYFPTANYESTVDYYPIAQVLLKQFAGEAPIKMGNDPMDPGDLQRFIGFIGTNLSRAYRLAFTTEGEWYNYIKFCVGLGLVSSKIGMLTESATLFNNGANAFQVGANFNHTLLPEYQLKGESDLYFIPFSNNPEELSKPGTIVLPTFVRTATLKSKSLDLFFNSQVILTRVPPVLSWEMAEIEEGKYRTSTIVDPSDPKASSKWIEFSVMNDTTIMKLKSLTTSFYLWRFPTDRIFRERVITPSQRRIIFGLNMLTANGAHMSEGFELNSVLEAAGVAPLVVMMTQRFDPIVVSPSFEQGNSTTESSQTSSDNGDREPHAEVSSTQSKEQPLPLTPENDLTQQRGNNELNND